MLFRLALRHVWLVPLLLVLVPSSARAGDDGGPATASAPCSPCDESKKKNVETAKEDAEPMRRRWYGWQNLTVDGASVLVAPILPPLGLGGYLLGSPIVHAAHERYLVAGGSLLLRVALPATGAYIACAGDRCRGDLGALAMIPGLALGALGAVAIDAALLSWQSVPVAKPEAARRSERPFAIAPNVAPRREGGVDVGLGGTF